MNEAVANVCVMTNDDGTLRGRCAHLPCCDRGEMKGMDGVPVPASVPGEFVICLGDDDRSPF